MIRHRLSLPSLGTLMASAVLAVPGWGEGGVTEPEAQEAPVVDRHAPVPADAVKGAPAVVRSRRVGGDWQEPEFRETLRDRLATENATYYVAQ